MAEREGVYVDGRGSERVVLKSCFPVCDNFELILRMKRLGFNPTKQGHRGRPGKGGGET